MVVNDMKSRSFSKKIIRFYVIGNSNSYIDQDIKIKIKNAIVETYSPLFNNVNNIHSARKIIPPKIIAYFFQNFIW